MKYLDSRARRLLQFSYIQIRRIGLVGCVLFSVLITDAAEPGATDVDFALARDPVLAGILPVRRSPMDFDGDGKTDISIYRQVGQWWIARSSDGNVAATAMGSGGGGDMPVPADFTGDGKTDTAAWNRFTGKWYVVRSENNTFFTVPFGTNGDIPMPADFDGDLKADFAVFRPSSGTWFIEPSGGGTTIFFQFGLAGDLPVSADYDGDGKADIAIYRPTASDGAEWWVMRSTAGLMALPFGIATDKAVP